MSAGRFTTGRYETDGGDVVLCQVQPETLALAITGPGTNSSSTTPASSSAVFPLNMGGRRRKPFAARYVAIRFTGNVPDGYAAGGIYRIPVMRTAFYNGISKGQVGTYLGQAIEVQYKVRQQGDY